MEQLGRIREEGYTSFLTPCAPSCTPNVGELAEGCFIRLYDMNIRVRIAVMSHLSDAQAMLDFNLKKEATNEINLAKAILLAHPNTDDWATENELNEIAEKLKQQ